MDRACSSNVDGWRTFFRQPSTPGTGRRLRHLAVPLLAVAVVGAAEWLSGDTVVAPVNAADFDRSGYGPASHAEALEQAGAQVALGVERVSNDQTQWLRHESLARAYLARSRLTHTYDDLARAGKALAVARHLAPPGSGPSLTDAIFAQMTHQLGRAEESLAAMDQWAAYPEPGMRAESLSLKGDVAFYRSDFKEARRLYQEARRHGGDAGVSYRLAILAKSVGDFDAAIDHFHAANPRSERSAPLVNANTAMQIGAVELARGNYAAAGEWFAVADRQFPGFWLIEAHLAQAQALTGDVPGAIASMREIARRAPSAEVMDALAMLLRTNGQASEARQWARRAGAIWDRRLGQLPQAAYGHALEHEMLFGSPSRALELAQRNLSARPYGESRILLASALLMNGRPQAALAQLAAAERSGWRSAPLYAVRAQAFEMSGRQEEAVRARYAATALNPRIFEPETALIWFSHG